MPLLGVPFGSYGHSPQFVQSKDGAIYTTSIGDMGKKRSWRGRVWRIAPGAKPEIVFEAPGAHLALHVQGDKLYCAWIDLAGKPGYDEVPGYIPLTATVTSSVVSIDESQVAQLKAQLAAAQEAASRAQRAAEVMTSRFDLLKARVIELEKNPAATGSAPINEQKIADIVWAKVWDVLWILRTGMREVIAGRPVTDPNVAGWAQDLTAFIKKEKGL